VRIAAGLALDGALICLFAAIGRHNHDEPGSLLGVATTAWPFLAGMTAGWLASVLALGRAPFRVSEGLTVWIGTVAIGMVLRSVTDAGTAPAFIVVATVLLGSALLGWRAVAAALAAGRRP
jgi:hypothetical protein